MKGGGGSRWVSGASNASWKRKSPLAGVRRRLLPYAAHQRLGGFERGLRLGESAWKKNECEEENARMAKFEPIRQSGDSTGGGARGWGWRAGFVCCIALRYRCIEWAGRLDRSICLRLVSISLQTYRGQAAPRRGACGRSATHPSSRQAGSDGQARTSGAAAAAALGGCGVGQGHGQRHGQRPHSTTTSHAAAAAARAGLPRAAGDGADGGPGAAGGHLRGVLPGGREGL